LYEFNGGDACVNKHMSKITMPIGKDADLAVDTSKRAEWIDKPVPDKRLKEFFDQVLKMCQDEFKIISKVFPNPAVLMKQLIQVIFSQRVTNAKKKT
jgi:hypothetical protein